MKQVSLGKRLDFTDPRRDAVGLTPTASPIPAQGIALGSGATDFIRSAESATHLRTDALNPKQSACRIPNGYEAGRWPAMPKTTREPRALPIRANYKDFLPKQLLSLDLTAHLIMMNACDWNGLLAMGVAPTQPGQQAPPMWTSLVPLVLLVAVFYFALIRPQQKKQKEHAELLKAIRPGDKVITTGGVVGVIVTVKEKTATIRSADAKFEITKSAIAEITERSGEPSPG